MEANIKWLDDPQVFPVGQLPVSGRDLGVRLFGECEKPAGRFLPGKCR